jgi:hypothetical protein
MHYFIVNLLQPDSSVIPRARHPSQRGFRATMSNLIEVSIRGINDDKQ